MPCRTYVMYQRHNWPIFSFDSTLRAVVYLIFTSQPPYSVQSKLNDKCPNSNILIALLTLFLAKSNQEQRDRGIKWQQSESELLMLLWLRVNMWWERDNIERIFCIPSFFCELSRPSSEEHKLVFFLMKSRSITYWTNLDENWRCCAVLM